MDTKRKKEILKAWKNRRPEMGVISISCKPTGDLFLGISKDTRSEYNSNCFKLSVKLHPNKQLQELWDKYGESELEYSVLEVLKYENPEDDQTDNLLELLECCLMEMPTAPTVPIMASTSVFKLLMGFKTSDTPVAWTGMVSMDAAVTMPVAMGTICFLNLPFLLNVVTVMFSLGLADFISCLISGWLVIAFDAIGSYGLVFFSI